MKSLIVACIFLLDWMGVFGQNMAVAETTILKNAFAPKVYYGTASYYADKFDGRKTATGATYSPDKLTAACNVLPLGSWIRVTNLQNGKTVIVQTNDRLHPKNKRIVDMSKIAATQLGYVSRGLTKVKVEVLGVKKKAGEAF